MTRTVLKIFLLTCLSIAASACSPTTSEAAGTGPTAVTALGAKIFNDKALSAKGNLACKSCHRPDYAFAQPVPVPDIYEGRQGTRNVPSLLDIPYVTAFFWDGRESNLNRAVLAAFTNRAEMGQPDMQAVLAELRRHEGYRTLFKDAYGNGRIEEEQVAASLIAYLNSIPKGKSKYDALTGDRLAALSDSETRGLEIFKGKADCSSCHSLNGSPAPFTDNLFHHSNVGFERISGNVSETLKKLQSKMDQSVPISELVLSDPDFSALGRLAVTGRPGDLSAYRTPTLRNVSLTAPYMHDGSVPTLEEAVQREIYYRSLARGNPISLTVEEQRDLISFLKSLEDKKQ